MEHAFTSEFFAGNRRRLRELFTGTAPIVLTANGLLQRSADEAYPFKQDASFWYLTGIDEPDVLLVMDKDKEYLIVPGRESVRVIFEGAVDEAELKRISGIDTVYDEEQGWKQLGTRLKKAKHLATLAAAPAYMQRLGMYSNPARRRLLKQVKAWNEAVELLDISQHVARLRMVKQPEEIAAIQGAIGVTAQGIKMLRRNLKRGAYGYEYELEADLFRHFRKAGLRGHGFDPVVASGLRACTMHNNGNEGKLSSDELVLFDVGAEYDHYTADLARTVSVSGSPSRRQQAVHEAVLEVQAYAFSLLKPGVLFKEYEEAVEQFMGEKLRELGLIKTIEHDVVRKFYPHATSHFLGLNAHDAGLYDRPMEAGMVLAVEPGIYIPAESIGVRVEDDALITPEGNRVLSSHLGRELA